MAASGGRLIVGSQRDMARWGSVKGTGSDTYGDSVRWAFCRKRLGCLLCGALVRKKLKALDSLHSYASDSAGLVHVEQLKRQIEDTVITQEQFQ